MDGLLENIPCSKKSFLYQVGNNTFDMGLAQVALSYQRYQIVSYAAPIAYYDFTWKTLHPPEVSTYETLLTVFDAATGERAGPIDLIYQATGLTEVRLFDEAAALAHMDRPAPPPDHSPDRTRLQASPFRSIRGKSRCSEYWARDLPR